MSEDKFVVQDSCGDGYALEFAYGIVDLIDDNGHVVTEFDWDDFPLTPDDVYNNPVDCAVTHWMPLPELPEEVRQ